MTRHRQTQEFDKDRGVMPPGCGETGTYRGDAEGIGLDTEVEAGLGATAAQGNAGLGGETGETAPPGEADDRSAAAEKAANWPGD
jgi:hypothetical protein